jgi:hypothetical protein
MNSLPPLSIVVGIGFVIRGLRQGLTEQQLCTSDAAFYRNSMLKSFSYTTWDWQSETGIANRIASSGTK